jgi:hypothetical protein
MATTKLPPFNPAKAFDATSATMPTNYTGWVIFNNNNATVAEYVANGKNPYAGKKYVDLPAGSAYLLTNNQWQNIGSVGAIPSAPSIAGKVNSAPFPPIPDNRPKSATDTTNTPTTTTNNPAPAQTSPTPNKNSITNKSKTPPTPAPTDNQAAATPASTPLGAAIPADITGKNVKQVEAQLNAEYPAIYTFWMSDPVLKPIFEQSVADGTIASLQTGSTAAAQRLTQRLQPWIQQNGSSLVAAKTDEAANPTKYAETLSNRETYIKDQATQLGYNNLDDATISKIAQLTFTTDYSDTTFGTVAGQDRLKTYLAQSANAAKLTGGTAATERQDLIDYNNQMGNPYSSAWIDSAVADIADPSKNVDPNTYKTMIKTAAAAKYSGFSDQINKGVSVQQIADPYISTMTNLLELPYNTSNYSQYLNDPLIQKGLAATVNSDGTTQPMTNYDFANMVRQDPRWAYTNNARDSVNSMLHQIGKDFGFVS